MKASDLASPMKKLDSFPASVPGFNIRGEKIVSTSIGGCVTFIMLSVTFLFATLKFQHLILRHNPSINSHTEYFANRGSRFDINQPDFQIAVSLNQFGSFEPLSDPNYLQWVAQYIQYKNGQLKEYGEPIPLRRCSEEDLANLFIVESE